MGAKHLAPPRAEVHLRRVLAVHCHAKGGAARVDAGVEPLPAFAQVRRPHDAALFAAEVHAHAGVQCVGVAGITDDAARVLDVGEPVELAVLPRSSAVGAPPHARAVGDQHRLRICAPHGHAVQVQQVHVAGELAVADRPAVAAVRAARRAPHFQGRVHVVRVARLNVDSQDAHGKRHLHLLRIGHGCDVGPVLAAVLALVYLGALGAQEHDVGVVGVEPNGPDHPPLGHVHALPVVTAVGAPVDAPLRSAKDRARIVGMNGDGPSLSGRRQPIAEQIPVSIARRLPVQSAGFGANVNDSVACHDAAS